MPQPTTYTFAVYPADFDEPEGFAPFLLEVPTLLGQAAAARRAYFAAMARLDGIAEPEAFHVCAFDAGRPGELVTAQGLAGCRA